MIRNGCDWAKERKNIGEAVLAGFEHSGDEKMNYKIMVLGNKMQGLLKGSLDLLDID